MSDNEKFIISVAVIGLLFITTVVYYFMLRRFMAHVRRRQESIWIDIRSNARIGETDIATSYKLLAAIKRQKYKGVKLDEVTLLAPVEN